MILGGVALVRIVGTKYKPIVCKFMMKLRVRFGFWRAARYIVSARLHSQSFTTDEPK